MSEYKMRKDIKSKKRTKQTVNTIKCAVVGLIAFVLASMVGINLYTSSLPPIKNLEEFKPNIVTQIYSQDGQIIKTFTAFNSSSIKATDVPEIMKKAFIATEDKNFYKHKGYDPFGLLRSSLANIKAGRFVQGASTITQQLARILFLSNEKTFDRKIKEFIISARIEKSIPKDKILEMYLNNVYLGSGAYGVAGAADIYFKKDLQDLSLAETALIAGLPQAPSIYSPFHSIEKAEKRRNQVLARMLRQNYITKAEYEAAKNEEIKLTSRPNIYTYNKAPYFVDFVMRELESLGFDETDISTGGYKITTTLNYETQKAADEAVKKYMNAYGLKKDKEQAAVFSFSPITGQIYVYIGGKDYSKTQYDRVSQAQRPPGSSFKPFVYAAAIDKGLDPNMIMDDAPVTIADWSPQNYGHKYRGKQPLYLGLVFSSNVMAAKLIQEVGIRQVINLARALGISTPLEYDYTIALGSNSVKLNEMSIAYGAFANGGFKVKPYAVERIETSRGKIIYQAPKTKISKVLDLNTAATLTAIMRKVITNGTGMAANIGKPAAGKTGTTDDYKDAWFVGYTPDVVTGVWVGNDDNLKMSTPLTGGTVPALIWKETMSVITKDYPTSDFNYPEVVLVARDKLLEEAREAENAEQNAEETDEENINSYSDDGIPNDIPVNPKLIIPNVKNPSMTGIFNLQSNNNSNANQHSEGSNQNQKDAPVPAPVQNPPQVKVNAE